MMVRIGQGYIGRDHRRTTDDSANPSTRMRYQEERRDGYIGKTSGQVEKGSGQAVPQATSVEMRYKRVCRHPNCVYVQNQLAVHPEGKFYRNTGM